MIKQKKERLDLLLIEKGFADTREKAKRMIMADLVRVNGEKADKVGTRYDKNSQVVVEKSQEKYVSRGGYKLEKALNQFDICIKGITAADIGASTGGFTDCLLQYGALKVYSIDVGYGQLDWKLRQDDRIVNIEKTNIRYLNKNQIDLDFDLVTIDVSFISLTKVLPVVKKILKKNGKVIALVKPQFEAGREKVKKGGIVNDPDVHREVLKHLIETIKEDYSLVDATFSPIKNSPGNIEFLILLNNEPDKDPDKKITLIDNTVILAHQYFKLKPIDNHKTFQ